MSEGDSTYQFVDSLETVHPVEDDNIVDHIVFDASQEILPALDEVLPLERTPRTPTSKVQSVRAALGKPYVTSPAMKEVREIFAHDESESDAEMLNRLLWKGEERLHLMEIAVTAEVSPSGFQEQVIKAGVKTPNHSEHMKLTWARDKSIGVQRQLRRHTLHKDEPDDIIHIH